MSTSRSTPRRQLPTRAAGRGAARSVIAALVETMESRVLLSADPADLSERPVGAVAPAAPIDLGSAPLALAPAAVASAPERPRVFLNTTYTPGSGKTINVPAGGDVQAAVNAAQPGDTITLAAGATFTGNFSLPNKNGNAWVTIRTSTADASLPAPGTRITPAQSGLMAKLVSPNSNAALATQSGAHHYRFIGIEFAVASGVGTNTGVVVFGSGSQTAAQTPNNLILDRVYIHGNAAGNIQNGLRLNSASTAIIDSYFDQCQATSFESHNIGGYNGPGPYKIVNNRFGAATIPVLFGGAVPSVNGLVPSDIEFRRNYISRPRSWRPGDPSYAGTQWYVKNLFELKNARRVLFDGNVLEHNWPHTGPTPDGSPQHGYAILLTVRHEGGAAPWATVSDVTLTNNIVRKSNVGISLSGTEGQGTHRIKIENNLFDDIGLSWGNNDRSGMFAQVNTVGDLMVNHNTIINDGDIIFANGAEVGDLDYTNNISNHNAARPINKNRGINAPGAGIGTTALNAKFVQYDVTKNVMANATPTPTYPAGNFFPANFAAVGFSNLAARDYRLASNSPFKNAGTDGKDIGADIDAVAAATAGAISGVWSTQTGPNPGGPYNVNEGSSITLAGTAAPGAQLQWDLNYNGTTFDVDASGPNPLFSAANIDGAATRTIAARTTAANVRTTTVRIANVAPKATFAPGAAVTLGTASSVSFSNRTDPSPADVAAGFKYSYDFNNDGDFTDVGDVANSSSASASFKFASAGTFSVRGRISDNDGGFTGYTTTVSVKPTSSSTVTLSATADAHVRDGSFSGTNYGSAATLEVKRQTTGYNRQAYFTFNLSSLANITSAKLRLHGRLTSNVTGGLSAAVYPVSNTGWKESTLTFNNKPAAGGTALAQVKIVGTTAKYYEFDVTNYLKQQKAAGKSLVSFVVRATVSNAGLMNFSSRNATSNRPQLRVAHTPLKTLVVSSNALNVNEGSSRSFTVKLGAQPTANVTVTIQRQGGDGSLTSSLASLLFTPTNWNTARSVSILASQDADAINGSATFTLTASGYATTNVVAKEVDDEFA